MSGSFSKSSLLAVLRFTFSPGVSLAAAPFSFSVGAGLADGAGSLAGIGFSAAGAALGAGTAGTGLASGTAALAGPTVTLSFRASTLALLMPFTLLKSSTLLKGRAAMIFWAVAGPTPGRASKVF